MKKQFANTIAVLLILGASSSAYAQSTQPVQAVRGKATKCIQGMTLPNAVLAAQKAPVPRVLVESGNEILRGTAGSAVIQIPPKDGHVSEVGHRIRMRFRMSDVKTNETNKFIDFTTLCRGWAEQNVDYVEECSLEPGSKPLDPASYPKPLTAYQTRTTLRDGKVDGCRHGISVQIEYAIIIDPVFLNLVGGAYLMVMSNEQVNARLQSSTDALFNNWVSGFKP